MGWLPEILPGVDQELYKRKIEQQEDAGYEINGVVGHYYWHFYF